MKKKLPILLATVVIGAVSYYFAVMSDLSLVYLLLLSYGFIAQIFPVLLATFFWERSTRSGVLWGLFVGCAVTVLCNLFPQLQWQGIHAGVWGLLANLATMITVSLRTRPMDEDHVAQFVVR